MNKKINDYITNNYDELRTISSKITRGHQLSDELLQECLLQIYEKTELILRNYDDNSIKYYIIAVMKLNWNSKTSRFYYKIRKEQKTYVQLHPSFVNYIHDDTEEKETYEEVLKAVEEHYTELTWFSKRLMELYLTLGSLKKVSKETQIPLASVGRYIREIKYEIRINVQNQLNDGKDKK
jgi:hypothetical protein